MTEAPKKQWKIGDGRPPGAKNRKPSWMREWCEERSPAILEKMSAMALEGNTKAAELVLEQAFPPPKDKPLDLPNLPKMENASDALAIATAIGAAMAAGVVTPLEASNAMNVLERIAKMAGEDELERRIRALEEANAVKDETHHVAGPIVINPWTQQPAAH